VTGARVRPADAQDAAAIAAIYAPYVHDTAITFELEAPDAAAMRARIEAGSALYPWLVAEIDGAVRGYAYAGLFRTRAAYRWTVETTVYVDRDYPRRGLGRALYERLIADCAAQGFVTALGVVALPNAASVALHEAVGFVHTGTEIGVGHKFRTWHDVGVWQRDLAPRTDDPPEPWADR
jgi:L-amino acid N-acyltransferase YncA